MSETFSETRVFAMLAHRARRIVFLTLLIALAPLCEAAAGPCDRALPLPLDDWADGFATPRQPAHYAIEAEAPGLLVVEAHGVDRSTEAPSLRWLDRSCRAGASNLPVSPIHGRHVHRIETAGTYFVEVRPGGSTGTGFRVGAWMVVAHRASNVALDWSIEEDPPEEPMDESDELRFGGGGGRSDAPTPANDRRGHGRASGTWRELPGHGLLQIGGSSAPGSVRFHDWCPWAESPELLATFTCARSLRADATGMIAIRTLLSGSPQIYAVHLASGGRIALDADDDLVRADLVDPAGRYLGEMRHGEPTLVPGSRGYLRIEATADIETVLLDVDLD